MVDSQRRTIITHDLDIYKFALQIQQSVVNTNWTIQVVFYLQVFASQHDLGKTIAESGFETCAIESVISAALRGNHGDNIDMYRGGIEYHITTNLAITIVSHYAIIHVVHQRRLSMNTFYEDILYGTQEIQNGNKTMTSLLSFFMQCL